MEEPKENKGMKPPSITPSPSSAATSIASAQGEVVGKVKVKISRNRAIEGVGRAGDVVMMAEDVAKQYERDGFVTIL